VEPALVPTNNDHTVTPREQDPHRRGSLVGKPYLGSSKAWMKLRLCQILARMCLRMGDWPFGAK